MSQLIISRIFKPSVCKKFLRHTNVRLFSVTPQASGLDPDDKTKVNRSFSSKPAYPFLLIDYILKNPGSCPDGLFTAESCSKKKEVTINDKKLMEEVCDAMTVGFSRDGLRVKLEGHYNDFVLRYVIYYNPTDPNLEDMTVRLPPLPRGSQIQSMAMSSLPAQDKDWVVAVKLSGSRLSLCRPFGSSKWINIKAMPQCINPLSSLMFSKKDQRFYIPTPGGNLLCSLDIDCNEDDLPEFIELEFDDLPKSVFKELADVSSCSRTDHLVESPTGQLFLVKWYGEDLDDYDDDDKRSRILMHVTKKFMVFRANEESDKFEKTMIYTEDIGDLCIFVGHSEAFCVPASSSLGLKPNCIYFVGYNFGVYDLTTKTCTTFHKEDDVPIRKLDFPYWPSPNFSPMAPN
ncbi:hypothetical protein V5N11_015165 [Cardamine amara subsp. amara]|uniref:KIB1-4 beta-propeller domain-containing protein n=1 Tax=Cardamine amara subsp. amara TaxID=228776 RepID=A0ABD1A9Y8_CARAN